MCSYYRIECLINVSPWFKELAVWFWYFGAPFQIRILCLTVISDFHHRQPFMPPRRATPGVIWFHVEASIESNCSGTRKDPPRPGSHGTDRFDVEFNSSVHIFVDSAQIGAEIRFYRSPNTLTVFSVYKIPTRLWGTNYTLKTVKRENVQAADAFILSKERGLTGLYIQDLSEHSRRPKVPEWWYNYVIPTKTKEIGGSARHLTLKNTLRCNEIWPAFDPKYM
jgi:hypothetical protein